jgi:hypothetical protein
MNIAKLYQQPAISTTFSLYTLSRHVPEYCEYDEDVNKKIEIRTLAYECPDGRRCWELATVWFEGKPFGVIQNAGREGREHNTAFWTDKEIYSQAMLYLQELYLQTKPPEITPLDFDAPELIEFYNRRYKPASNN